MAADAIVLVVFYSTFSTFPRAVTSFVFWALCVCTAAKSVCIGILMAYGLAVCIVSLFWAMMVATLMVDSSLCCVFPTLVMQALMHSCGQYISIMDPTSSIFPPCKANKLSKNLLKNLLKITLLSYQNEN